MATAASPPTTFEIPGRECEVYVSRVPIQVRLTDLISMFEKYGSIYSIRYVKKIRGSFGHVFVRFFYKSEVRVAISKFNGFEVKPHYPIKVCPSVANPELMLFNIGNQFSSEEIVEEVNKHTHGLVNVKVIKGAGRAILKYSRVDYAQSAKHTFLNGPTLWGQSISVEWNSPKLEDPEFDYPEGKHPLEPVPRYVIDNQVVGQRPQYLFWVTRQTDRHNIDELFIQPRFLLYA